MHSPVLAPMAVLILWSLIMLIWGVAARMPALKKVGIDLAKVRGSRPGQLDGVLPDSAQWIVHNYNHLMEQPTIFYAVCAVLALSETGGGLNLYIAWGYTLVRIAHSLVQATSNIIAIRFSLFALSSVLLLMLSVHALIAVFR